MLVETMSRELIKFMDVIHSRILTSKKRAIGKLGKCKEASKTANLKRM